MPNGDEKKMENGSAEKSERKKRKEFSKRLIFWEGLLVCVLSIGGLYMAYLSIINSYLGSLPWLTAMVTGAWGAYGVSQAFYYNKAKAENILKINKFDSNSFDVDL